MAGNKVKKAHDTLVEKAERYLGVLAGVNSPEATDFADKIRPGVDSCIASVSETLAYKDRIKLLKQRAKSASADLKMAVGGIYALIQATDLELYAKLPPRENWSDAAGSEQARHLVNALNETGSSTANTYANQIETVAGASMKAQQALAAVGSGKTSIADAATAMAELRMLIGQADLYLRKLAPPGSVLAGLLTQARGVKSGKKPGSTVPSTGTSGNASSTSTGGSTAAIAPMVNGAIGPQVVNGAHG